LSQRRALSFARLLWIAADAFDTVRPLPYPLAATHEAFSMLTGRCPLVFAGLFFATLLSGCGERPFINYGIVDPWARRSWQEDERFGPTYYTKREELRDLRKSLDRASPAEQERMAVELAARLEAEEHPVLRGDILRTLAKLPSPVAAEAIRQATADPDPDVRIIACAAWGERGGAEARQALTQVLGSDTDNDVRIAATRELGRFKNDPEAMQALKLALNENDPAMQFRAVESLKNMSGRDYGSDLVAWKEYVDGGNPKEPPAASIAERIIPWY
jgi:hypothetical protein